MKRVMVFGTFDILHPGHIEFLRQAKRYGDFLIVSLAREKNIQRIKGRRAIHSERERKKMLQAVKFVNKVVIGAKEDYLGHILQNKPQVIALGYDQRAYTKDLAKLLSTRRLKVKIIRLKAYKPGVYKSSKLFQH